MTNLTTSGTALLGVLSVLGALSLVATSRADPGRFEFEAAIEIECGLRQAQLSVTDVDGDGIRDIVALGETAQLPSVPELRVLLGDGFGGFEPAYTGARIGLRTPTQLLPFAADDDGRPDFLAVGGLAYLLLDDGEGGYTSERLLTEAPTVAAAALCDLNDDDRLDILATDVQASGATSLQVLLSQGDGTFTQLPPVGITSAPGPYEYFRISTGDFDGDGRADAAVVPLGVTSSTEPARVLFGNGDGTFVQDGVAPPIGGQYPRLEAADLNDDGRADLTDGRHVHLGRADRTFQTLTDAATAPQNAVALLADVDGDTVADLFAQAAVSCGNGDGTFGAENAISQLVPGTSIRQVTDITGDGLADVLATHSTDTRLRLVPQRGLPAPTVLGTITELTEPGRQVIRITGTGFRAGTTVVSLGDLIVHGVTVESAEALLVDIEVPPRIGVARQPLVVRNPDARSDPFDVAVRGLFVRNARGKLVNNRAPGRDRVELRGELEFTQLSARGEFVDVRDGLRLEFGDPAEPLVLDIPAGDPGWRLIGPTVPARFVYKTERGTFPRLKIVVDTARGRIKVKARDLDLPGEPDALVLLRAVLVGETGEDRQTFALRTRRRGLKQVLRRR